MKARVNQTVIELLQGDITRQETDAIVNAANNALLGGGGVDGAIHRAAGPQLLAETRTLGGCDTGDAKITGGYNLKARHVIHTVGPIYRQGDPDVVRLLRRAHQRSLEVAVENALKTITFPAISTGIFGYPVDKAAQIALSTTCDFAAEHTQLQLVRFALFDKQTLAIFASALHRLIEARADLSLIA